MSWPHSTDATASFESPRWLLIDVDQKPDTGRDGQDVIVGRTVAREDHRSLERHVEGWRWKKVARVRYRLEGAEPRLVLPHATLGLAASATLALDFKWIDNAQHPRDLQDVHVSGDVAPGGRFRLRFRGE